ncbi:hypothetical protein Micbo1qcDRAFT_18059 [Microdochium bolleyi]|uniref:Uncharacterized protein n=1 Tax=Microdochium bolleyi TaxID=196109 RepID=A0A136IUJ6_9PEZI|nr:hypothetical protein Micbo1qcDRAFT_18059 [Microdochium bolleyi]
MLWKARIYRHFGDWTRRRKLLLIVCKVSTAGPAQAVWSGQHFKYKHPMTKPAGFSLFAASQKPADKPDPSLSDSRMISIVLKAAEQGPWKALW